MTNMSFKRKFLRIFLPAFGVAFTGAAAPGPMLALVVSQTLARGFDAVWAILLGHALLEVVIVGAILGGLSRPLRDRRMRGVLGLVGGLVMCWMGWDLWMHAESATLYGMGERDVLGLLSLVGAGAGVSLSNPYFTGWWATVGSGNLAALGVRGAGDAGHFLLGHELGDVVWYVFVAAVLLTGRPWLTDSVYQNLLVGCAAVIGLIGLGFIALALRFVATRRRGAETERNTET